MDGGRIEAENEAKRQESLERLLDKQLLYQPAAERLLKALPPSEQSKEGLLRSLFRVSGGAADWQSKPRPAATAATRAAAAPAAAAVAALSRGVFQKRRRAWDFFIALSQLSAFRDGEGSWAAGAVPAAASARATVAVLGALWRAGLITGRPSAAVRAAALSLLAMSAFPRHAAAPVAELRKAVGVAVAASVAPHLDAAVAAPAPARALLVSESLPGSLCFLLSPAFIAALGRLGPLTAEDLRPSPPPPPPGRAETAAALQPPFAAAAAALAVRLAAASPRPTHRHGAALVAACPCAGRGGDFRILATGCNEYVREPPAAAAAAAGGGSPGVYGSVQHAEIGALAAAVAAGGGGAVAGSCVYVAELDDFGVGFASAHACPACTAALVQRGIAFQHFSTPNGFRRTRFKRHLPQLQATSLETALRKQRHRPKERAGTSTTTIAIGGGAPS